MLKIAVIFGTRPEVIKLYSVLEELRRHKGRIDFITIATGQHEELMDGAMRFFSIKPDYNLRIMRKNQTLCGTVKNLMPGVERILRKEKPDLVLVQGDTSSTFIASLCAFYLHIPVAHIEGGLRTFNKYSPFPEEINRCMIGRLALFNFVPTRPAGNNLLKEGVPGKYIFLTGNTGIDALLRALKDIKLRPFSLKGAVPKKKLLVVTVHRRDNFGRPLVNICKAIKALVKSERDIEIVFVVHPNPNVKGKVKRFLNNVDRVRLAGPLDYRSFILLLKRSYLILTDSGGIQEEAPYLKKPVLVLREDTERREGLEAGVSRLIGTVEKDIVRNVRMLLKDRMKYRAMITSRRIYGDGKASRRIVKQLLKYGDKSAGKKK